MLSVSVVIVAKNSERMLEECLERLIRQDYDMLKMEVLVVDGGSTDRTRDIALEKGAKVIHGGFPDNAEARRFVGLQHASHEIILYLDSDNLIPHSKWLERMLQPFRDEEIMASFTKWYGIEDGMALLDRYYSMIGGNDPIVYYLGKQDRVPFLKTILPFGAQLVSDHEGYLKVKFQADKLPTLGCNGFLIRRSYLESLRLESPEHFFHIDVHVDLLKQHPNAYYGIVKTSIVHLTGQNILSSLKKRLSYKRMHYDGLNMYRRYKVFDPSSVRDWLFLAWAIICSLTLVEPIVRSILGYIRTNDKAWFLHPVVLPLMTMTYVVSFVFPYKRTQTGNL